MYPEVLPMSAPDNGAAGAGATGDSGSPGGQAQQPEGGSGQQAQQPGWLAGVKQELREKVSSFKTVSDLASAYIEKDERLGKAVVIPQEGATEQERLTFYSTLGVPAKVDGYEFVKPQLPEGMSVSPATEQWFRETALTLHLSKGQAKALYTAYNAHSAELFIANAAEKTKKREEALATLKADPRFGPKLEENLANARQAVRKLADEEFDQFLEETGLTNDPRMVRFMNNLGRVIKPDSMPPGSFGSQERPRDPQDAESWDFPNSFPRAE